MSSKPGKNLEKPQPRLPTLGGRLLVVEAVWWWYPRRVTDLSYGAESSAAGITATHARKRPSLKSNMHINLELMHNWPCTSIRNSSNKTKTVHNTACRQCTIGEWVFRLWTQPLKVSLYQWYSIDNYMFRPSGGHHQVFETSFLKRKQAKFHFLWFWEILTDWIFIG
jgi:hypothetical protein